MARKLKNKMDSKKELKKVFKRLMNLYNNRYKLSRSRIRSKNEAKILNFLMSRNLRFEIKKLICNIGFKTFRNLKKN